MAQNIRLDITPDSDPLGTAIESWTEDEFSDLRLEISLNDLGRNSFKIPRRTWEISALEAFKTYYCRVYIPYLNDPGAYWGFWLVAGDYVLVHPDEAGGEDITIAGPGPGWILTKAVLNWQEWTPHAGVYVQDGTWYFEDKNYGDILTDLLGEDAASDHPALGDMGTPGWDGTNDVDGVPWEEFGGIFSQEVGTDYLSVIRALQRAGDLDVWVNQNLDLKAYVAFGEDRTGTAYGAGVVRFVGSHVPTMENQNILGSLTRHREGGRRPTHVLVLGNDRTNANGVIVEGEPIHHWVTSPDWSPGEAVHQATIRYETNSVNILEKAGLRYIRRMKDRSHLMVSAEVMPGNEVTQGLYLPGNEVYDKGHYWIGDLTTWKTGQGNDLDLTDTDLAIAKIRLQVDTASRDDTDEETELSLRVFIETGDDVSPSGSAASAVNARITSGCKCPIHPDPGDPGTPPTAPTEDFRWSFTDRGGPSSQNVYEDGSTFLYPWSQMTWEDNGASAWHDDYGAHISWGGAGANINAWLPISDAETYLIEADMSQRQSDSNVWLQARWYTAAAGTLLRTDYVAGPGVSVAAKAHYELTVSPPAGATRLRLFVDAKAGEFGAMDNVVISHGGSGGTPAIPGVDPPTTVGGTGEGTYSSSNRYVPAGSVLEHAYIETAGPYHEAADITYDNSTSLLTADDVQEALDEIVSALPPTTSFVTTHSGGGHTYHDYGEVSGTAELDLTDGNVLSVTLDGDTDITFIGIPSAVGSFWWVHVIGDGVSVPTFPDVLWPDGTAPTFDPAGGSHWLAFVSVDGEIVYGDAGGAAVTSSATIWRPVMAQDPSDDHWYVVVDGDGTAVMAEG